MAEFVWCVSALTLCTHFCLFGFWLSRRVHALLSFSACARTFGEQRRRYDPFPPRFPVGEFIPRAVLGLKVLSELQALELALK